MNQRDIFLRSEGNQWFMRNEAAISEVTKSCDFYNRYAKENYKILEIGCSVGNNLNFFENSTNCDCYGIDPSHDAIEYGKKKYKNINLSVGTSDILEFDDEYFDFVIFGFCLYLVDRKLLFKSLCEADRVLKNGGYLGITDFDPKYPSRRPYKHLSGLFSHKMNYSSIFLSIPGYSMVEKYSFSHSSELFSENVGERVSSVILYKNVEQGYIFEEDI